MKNDTLVLSMKSIGAGMLLSALQLLIIATIGLRGDAYLLVMAVVVELALFGGLFILNGVARQRMLDDYEFKRDINRILEKHK